MPLRQRQRGFMNSFHSFPWQVGSRFAVGDGEFRGAASWCAVWGRSTRRRFICPDPFAARVVTGGKRCATRQDLSLRTAVRTTYRASVRHGDYTSTWIPAALQASHPSQLV
jgi:hypothetical protein